MSAFCLVILVSRGAPPWETPVFTEEHAPSYEQACARARHLSEQAGFIMAQVLDARGWVLANAAPGVLVPTRRPRPPSP